LKQLYQTVRLLLAPEKYRRILGRERCEAGIWRPPRVPRERIRRVQSGSSQSGSQPDKTRVEFDAINPLHVIE
jgi:hypothetical protein